MLRRLAAEPLPPMCTSGIAPHLRPSRRLHLAVEELNFLLNLRCPSIKIFMCIGLDGKMLEVMPPELYLEANTSIIICYRPDFASELISKKFAHYVGPLSK